MSRINPSHRKHVLSDVEEAPTLTKKARDGETGELGALTTDLRRDEEFWYEDGTIVLLAGDVSFRVYKGVLAAHSPIFADMFSIPQPDTLSQSLSSESQPCPTVRVSDSSEDLRYVLRALLPSHAAMYVCSDPLVLTTDLMPSVFWLIVRGEQYPTFDEISAYARLGHKYEIDHLVDSCLAFLKDHFTDDLNKWCEHAQYVPLRFKARHAIGVVNIARLFECEQILPIALAVCCTLDPKVLMRGFKRADGTREALSRDDLLRCLQAKQALLKHASTALHIAFLPSFTFTPGCDTPTECQSALQNMYRWFVVDGGLFMDVHPFHKWEHYTEWMTRFTFCNLCEKRLEERVQVQQRHLWIKLPKILQLPVSGWGLSEPTEDEESEPGLESDSDTVRRISRSICIRAHMFAQDTE